MRLIDGASTLLCCTISTLKPFVSSRRWGGVWLGEKKYTEKVLLCEICVTFVIYQQQFLLE